MKKEIGIHLTLQTVDQMLVEQGSVFHGIRYLNAQAEELLLEATGRVRHPGQVRLFLSLPAAEYHRIPLLEEAIKKHFAYRERKSVRNFQEMIKLGFRNLFVACIFLGILVSLIILVPRVIPRGQLFLTVQELLIILGWVALWRPADQLLFDWRPFKREARLFRRFQSCSVEIIPEK